MHRMIKNTPNGTTIAAAIAPSFELESGELYGGAISLKLVYKKYRLFFIKDYNYD